MVRFNQVVRTNFNYLRDSSHAFLNHINKHKEKLCSGFGNRASVSHLSSYSYQMGVEGRSGEGGIGVGRLWLGKEVAHKHLVYVLIEN